MSEFSRRDFVKLSMGTAVALSSRKLIVGNAQALPYADPPLNNDLNILKAAFLVEQGRLSQIDQVTGTLFDSVNWQSPIVENATNLELLSPNILTLEELEQWAVESCTLTDALPETSIASPTPFGFTPVPIPAITAPFIGLPNTHDLVGNVLDTLLSGASLDLSLDFFYDSLAELSAGSMPEGILPNTGLETGFAPPFSSSIPHVEAVGSGPIIAAPPSVTLYGWRLQFRGPESHPLGSCVTQSVKHFHIELFRQNSRGGFDYVTNAHIGAYRSSGRRCFVLWNNYRPTVCWKICSPTWDQLKQLLVWIITAAAVIAGVVIAGWIIGAIASAAASVLWAPMLLLA